MISGLKYDRESFPDVIALIAKYVFIGRTLKTKLH